MNKLEDYLDSIRDKNILIQGLGLNGGGVGTALFFVENGINVTITDMKSAEILSKSIDELSNYSKLIKYKLGGHDKADFENADIVVKGPGVPPDNPFILAAAAKGALITSDIGIFMQLAPCPVYAITGSKGKSTTVSILHNINRTATDNAYLGGNITISPLTFYKKLNSRSRVVLELSSWQLRDIRGAGIRFDGAAITNLMNDHQNYYNNSMERYLADKMVIADNLDKNGFILIPHADKYIKKELITGDGKVYTFSDERNSADFIVENGMCVHKTEDKLINICDIKNARIKGAHNQKNMLIAAAMAYLSGLSSDVIGRGIETFGGVKYRMERVRVYNGITFINDTTATIPDAAVNAIKAVPDNLIWIGGGNDKNLDFEMMTEIREIPKRIFLLNGDGTSKMIKALKRDDVVICSSLEDVFDKLSGTLSSGDTVLLSPGATSFGMFNNEFHRGDIFNKLAADFK